MEQMDSITEYFGIKRYRSVAAVCAIYPDAQTVETHLYLKFVFENGIILCKYSYHSSL